MDYAKKFKTYPEAYQDLLMELVAVYSTGVEEIEEELGEYIVSDLDSYIARNSRRHWDDITMILPIKDKYFQFEWAVATGDTSIEDLGWEFDKNSVVEVIKRVETVLQKVITYEPVKMKGTHE